MPTTNPPFDASRLPGDTSPPGTRLLLERLAQLRLIVVTGKGGVGKSTIAATLGRILVEFGRRVLMLECDPRESVYQLLGVPPSGGQVVDVQPGLFVQNLRPRDVLDRIVREQLRVEFLSRRVLASPVYKHFADGAPGLKEMAILGHAFRVVTSREAESPEVDVVVLDAPASGHSVSLLAAPLRVAEVIQDGPFGRMGGELAEFVADPAQCGVVVVTQAEEMPVQESLELLDAMQRRLRRLPELVVVNGLWPRAPASDPLPDGGGPLGLWHQRRRVNEQELARLDVAWRGPRAQLPLLPLDRGPELLRELSGLLAVGLGVPESRWR